MGYTEHNLTDAQLIRLSQIVNSRPHNYGNALAALERKGLVIEKCGAGFKYQHSHAATPAGILALRNARLAGW
jgi:hypothetical protein